MKFRAIEKSIDTGSITQEQLDAISRYSRRELSADEVFIFSVILCDNEIDRDFERFSDDSLEKLAELFLGKTGVFDHAPKAANQSSRIFETKVMREERANSIGLPYACLKAWAYMVRCEKNEDLILEIDAGIKKEVSVGCAVEKILCSVCGQDMKSAECEHQKGKAYGGEICHHLLENPTDAYEWSFVAVPAQKNAGVVKGRRYPLQHQDMEEQRYESLEKLFSQKSAVTLMAADMLRLRAQYQSLLSLAKLGEEATEKLRRDVVKLALISDNMIDGAAFEAIVCKMDATELSMLAKSYGRLAGTKFPLSLQLAPASDGLKPETDCQFKI